ncbi:MAG: bifunctional phosphoribosylaminoimidazolecarboxamide formyltransferase/IMP cyclohydrolase [Pseudomonadota bacterium]
MSDRVRVARALLSVSDKTGLTDFANLLAGHGVELLSTGGTASALRSAGLTVRDVSDVTDFPEMLDGRVKTLHPAIHGGLLARRDRPDHMAALTEAGLEPIDLVVVNLYPFEATIAGGADHATAIESIDIGGPAMIRAAAKNHAAVAVLTDPSQYDSALLRDLRETGSTTAATRATLAAAAFAHTAAYDAAIAEWSAQAAGIDVPEQRTISGRLLQTLRYGENPHQSAAFYADGTARPGLATATQHQGKALSYNNINDTDAALDLVAEFDAQATAACVIVKHANPCGVGCDTTLTGAYTKAYDCDRVSAFGGIVAVNRPLDGDTAQAIVETFTEVVIAPGADDAARAAFGAKPNLRLLTLDALPDPGAPGTVLRQVSGGFLAQDRDTGRVLAEDVKVVTARHPNPQEMTDLLFAWTVAKHVKSNAIVYARDRATVGIGAGQMSRVDAARIAARKAEDMAALLALPESPATGAVVASDAFFPFADGLMAAASAGIRAVIQPGGSVRDSEVIEAADAAGLAMVFTGQRHFRH